MANEVKATLNMIEAGNADPRTYIEQHFPAIRNAAIALDAAGFSYSQMAAILKISKKAVWMHLTTHCELRNATRLTLIDEELTTFEQWIGKKAYHRS